MTTQLLTTSFYCHMTIKYNVNYYCYHGRVQKTGWRARRNLCISRITCLSNCGRSTWNGRLSASLGQLKVSPVLCALGENAQNLITSQFMLLQLSCQTLKLSQFVHNFELYCPHTHTHTVTYTQALHNHSIIWGSNLLKPVIKPSHIIITCDWMRCSSHYVMNVTEASS